MPYIVLVPALLLVAYLAASYYLYRRAFVPTKPRPLDDFTFTPFEFQADYEEVELVTADGVNFGAWHFRQPGSPQTVLEDNVRRAIKLPGAPIVWLAGLMFRLRTGCRLSQSSPITILSSLEPRPLFFIHGGADDLVAVNHGRRLYDAYRGPREIWIVQGAPHTGAYEADRPLYVERVAGFFARHLGLDVSSHLRLVEEEEVS